MPRRSKPKEAIPEQRSIQDPVSVELALIWQGVMDAVFYVGLLVAKERGEIKESSVLSLYELERLCPAGAYAALMQGVAPHIDKLGELLRVPQFGPVLEIQRRKRHA